MKSRSRSLALPFSDTASPTGAGGPPSQRGERSPWVFWLSPGLSLFLPARSEGQGKFLFTLYLLPVALLLYYCVAFAPRCPLCWMELEIIQGRGAVRGEGALGGPKYYGVDLMELSGLGQGQGQTRDCGLVNLNQNRMWSPRGLPGDGREEEPPC
ncbi:uncharacterized [Tachysurus ichikawai]